MKNIIVKVSVPYLHSDNPKASFKTRDGSWSAEVQITAPLTKFLGGKHEGYFRLQMNGQKIIAMTPVDSKLYYADTAPPEA